MKARRYLLYSILLIVLFGSMASECNEIPNGYYFRINRHGEDKQVYDSLPTYADGWMFPNYTLMGVGLYGTATDLVLVSRFDQTGDRLELRRINGTKVWGGSLNGSNCRISWDGNYMYYGNSRRYLSDYDLQETLFPDSLIENMSLSNISDDNRYLCYYTSSSTNGIVNIMLWDDLQKEHHIIQCPFMNNFGGAFYVSSLDRIYCLVDDELWSIKPDGSMSSMVHAFPASSNPRGGILLPGEQSFLLVVSADICKFSISQNTITQRIGGFSSYRYAPLSNELYLMAGKTISRYDMETEELSIVYRAGKDIESLGYGFGCSMDGNYIFLGAKE